MKIDIQVHTDASPCSRAAPHEIGEAAADAGLDGVVITDHDILAGYDAVEDTAPSSVSVIPGVEVTTTVGHLLAIGVDTVPERGPPMAVVESIHDIGGVAVLSHPFDRFREHYLSNPDGLEQLATVVDGVEVVNSRCLLPGFNRRADTFAAEHDLAPTGGSDAHFPMEIGRAVTVCSSDPVAAIQNGETTAIGRGSYLSGHIATKLSDAARLVGI